ncbi:helix-turn-helix DNA-binding domain protein [Streptomyces phage Zuko]|uniref:Helix-turn-helix DNA binding domain protein n=1 Tax=Streptomyces phage Zuko TaxID=2601695 RepID=A0A5J6D6Q9_9CAUD|nr:Rnase E [Streptomyces phage Zuko]QEQ93584.1 helix-turn-helix DNA-binding domain protein [Streptomyces phage Zuko]
MGLRPAGSKVGPNTTHHNKQKEAADAKRMFELRTGEAPECAGVGWTIARVADEMGCSVFRVQKLLNKYTPKLLDKDASRHRDIEIGKLDLLEERLWLMIDEEYYTVSNGQVVYFETGEPVPDIDPVMKIIDRLLKVMERRAKLLGLDKPVRVEATVHQVDNMDMELAEMIRRGRAESGGNHSRG